MPVLPERGASAPSRPNRNLRVLRLDSLHVAILMYQFKKSRASQ
jgi:hypothetical protein